jgi:hypothetical protein
MVPGAAPGSKPKKNHNLRHQRRRTIQHDVAQGPGSRGEIGLVPFIHAGHKCRHEKGNPRPTRRPARPGGLPQRRPPGGKHKQAQHEISDEVAHLSQIVVQDFEAGEIHFKQKMKQRIKIPAGVAGRQRVGGFDDDEAEPKPGRDPRLQYFLLMGRQAGSPAAAICSGLFLGIVRRLARNHHVVHVALAQARVADAHEASFLQQLRNRAATAISHP